MYLYDCPRGFSVIETLASFLILGIVTVIAVPMTLRTTDDIRLRGDAQAVNHMVGLAKMRAAAQFTSERLYVDVPGRAFHLQRWDKTSSTWVDDSAVSELSSGITFGWASVSAPPSNTQDSLAQSQECKNSAGSTITNTACIVFNSRGIPVDSSGSPFGNSAFYITDNATGVYGTTVSTTPLIRLWWSRKDANAWVKR